MLRAHGEVGEKRHTPGEWLASCSLHAKRYRNGEAIATGFVASTVHQVVRKRFCKRQQMPWSKRGAPPLLLQPHVKTLNRAWGTMCTRWYADMEVEERPDAPRIPRISMLSPHAVRCMRGFGQKPPSGEVTTPTRG